MNAGLFTCHHNCRGYAMLIVAGQTGNGGRTSLHFAAFRGHLKVVQYLVEEAKADLRVKDNNGRSALDSSIFCKKWWIVKWFFNSTNLLMTFEGLDAFFSKHVEKFSKEEVRGLQDKLKVLRGEERLKKVLKQASASNQYAADYRLLTKQLQEDIKLLSDPDVVYCCKQNIDKWLKKVDFNKQRLLPRHLTSVLKGCVHPSSILRTKFEFLENKKLRKDVNFFISHPAFNKIKKLVGKIRSCFNKIPDSKDFLLIKKELDRLRLYYLGYCINLCRAASKKEREDLKLAPVRIFKLNSDGDVVQRIVKPEVVDKLFKKGKNQHGGHVVPCYKGVHYKMFPHAPGIEAAVDSLNNLIAGAGSPPTQLLKVIDREGKHYIFLASKTIEGVELQDVVVQHKDLIEKLDPNNFSKMIILSLLTNPQDGKPDNYIVNFKTDSEGKVISWKIVGIDNDMAFAPSMVTTVDDRGQLVHLVFIRNILYFFPQMKNPFEKVFREQFINYSAEGILIAWLVALQQKNREYQSLLDRGVFHLSEYKGDRTISRGERTNLTPYLILENQKSPRGLQLPITLDQGAAKILYRRIRVIQALLKKTPEMTHDALFRYPFTG